MSETVRLARPTMKDVAALAGVAIKTVSRVMNDVPTVDPQLAERVHEAARKLNYRPNLTASSLRRADGRTRTIGVLLEDVSNPFSAALHRAVDDAARERHVFPLTGSLDEDAAREQELVRTLIDRRVDGLLVVPAGNDQSYLIQEQRAGCPVVFMDRQPAFIAADAVVSGNRQGATEAVRHLLSYGHRRIAYLGDSSAIWTARERFAGYREALSGAGIPVDPALVRHELSTFEAAAAAAHEILTLADPPTALFTSQNLITISALRALTAIDRHYRVAIVGFDDFLMADLLRPAITTVAQDPARIGTLAADILFRRINGDETPVTTHVVPTTLIPRGSGEIAPR